MGSKSYLNFVGVELRAERWDRRGRSEGGRGRDDEGGKKGATQDDRTNRREISIGPMNA